MKGLVRCAGALLLLPLALCAEPCVAGASPQGRWEGQVSVPGTPMRLIVDLAQDPASGWTGSVIVPGRNIKGAAMSDIVVSGADVSFTVPGVMSGPAVARPRVRARLVDAATMSGVFEQGGNSAPFTLGRTGEAQVDAAPKSTAVAGALEGTWSGTFELGGYPRTVTLTLANHPAAGAAAAATAELVVVGKKTTRVPIDLVVQDHRFLRIESHEAGITFEGQWREEAGQISGSFQMGPYDLPSVLSRSAAAAGSGS